MIRAQKKLPVGVLWKKTDAKGDEYFAGVISLGLFGEIPIVVFEEKFKDKEGSPDFIIRQATNKTESR